MRHILDFIAVDEAPIKLFLTEFSGEHGLLTG
jgi:hypothetical protein